jgi:hypothetical protein
LTGLGYPSPHLPQIHEAAVPKERVLIECGPFTNSASFKTTYAMLGCLLQMHEIVGRHRWAGAYPDWRLQVWLPPRLNDIYRTAVAMMRVAGVPVISSPLA